MCIRNMSHPWQQMLTRQKAQQNTKKPQVPSTHPAHFSNRRTPNYRAGKAELTREKEN